MWLRDIVAFLSWSRGGAFSAQPTVRYVLFLHDWHVGIVESVVVCVVNGWINGS